MQISPSGLHRSSQALNQTSQKVARGRGDLPSHAVNQIRSENSFKANAKVIQAQDEQLGTVIDLKA